MLIIAVEKWAVICGVELKIDHKLIKTKDPSNRCYGTKNEDRAFSKGNLSYLPQDFEIS